MWVKAVDLVQYVDLQLGSLAVLVNVLNDLQSHCLGC